MKKQTLEASAYDASYPVVELMVGLIFGVGISVIIQIYLVPMLPIITADYEQ